MSKVYNKEKDLADVSVLDGCNIDLGTVFPQAEEASSVKRFHTALGRPEIDFLLASKRP